MPTHRVDDVEIRVDGVGLRLFVVFTFNFRLCHGRGQTRVFTLITMSIFPTLTPAGHESFHSTLRIGVGRTQTSHFQTAVSLWADTSQMICNIDSFGSFRSSKFVRRSERSLDSAGKRTTPSKSLFFSFSVEVNFGFKMIIVLPLRKPDSLRNLAWLAGVNMSKSSVTTMYHRVINRLPSTNEFRPLFPDTNPEPNAGQMEEASTSSQCNHRCFV